MPTTMDDLILMAETIISERAPQLPPEARQRLAPRAVLAVGPVEPDALVPVGTRLAWFVRAELARLAARRGRRLAEVDPGLALLVGV